ncbi:hypothetical protein ACIA8O_11825 [Kitasatospora sp. NPDC051853]|uniref:hypothetical protein n=1 Tax=Kitasatospora sp. NPDC051853 TaxID=3364058 RepID=UPI0037B58853
MVDDMNEGGKPSPRDVAKARAQRIAEELGRLYRRTPSVTWTEEGHLRVSLRIAEQPDEALLLATLEVLGRGDRMGHIKRLAWQAIWAEVEMKMSEEPPAGEGEA